MNQSNPPPSEVKETLVVGSIRLQEVPFKVKSPIFEDVVIQRPIFVDKQIEVPVGVDNLVDSLVEIVSKRLLEKIELIIGARLDKAIDERISSIKSPKIIEEVTITYKDVTLDRPIFKDVEVSRPSFKDIEVLNPIIKDVQVLNAKIEDVTVINAVITDQKITNAIIKDVAVERAVIREKVVDVVHPRYLNLKGDPE